MRKMIIFLAGVCLSLAGSLTAFLPIPGGVLPLLLGVILMMSVSPVLQRVLRRARRRYRRLDIYCERAEEKLNPRYPIIVAVLAKTRP